MKKLLLIVCIILLASTLCYADTFDIELAGAEGTGDVTAVGNCTTGACLDGTSDGGTNILFYDAQGATTLQVGNNTGAVALTLPIATGTLLNSDGVGTSLTALNGENIQDDTIDDDSLDFTDITGVDFTLTDCGAVTSSGTITSSGTFDVTGATGLTLGSADVTSFTITTDGTGNAEFTLPADVIGDADIDWGTGAGQVSPADFANEDIGDITITTGAWAVEDDSHAHLIANIDAFTSAALYGQISDETGSASGSPLAVFSINPTLTGATLNGILDAGGATSLEVPNGADLTLDTTGEIGVNSTHNGFAWYDGTQEVFESSIKIAQGTFDLAAQWDVDSDLWLIDLDSTQFPHGIYITKIYVDCTVADPTTELDANIMYCDAVGGAAFPGANPTLIKAIDTTTGNFADAAVNTAVAADKSLYIDLDADPVDANTQYHIKIYYRIPES